MGVHAEGGINYNGREQGRTDYALRPALWLDISAVDTGAAKLCDLP